MRSQAPTPVLVSGVVPDNSDSESEAANAAADRVGAVPLTTPGPEGVAGRQDAVRSHADAGTRHTSTVSQRDDHGHGGTTHNSSVAHATTDMAGLAHTYAHLLMQKEDDLQDQQYEIQALRAQLAAARDQHVLHDRMMQKVLVQLADAQSLTAKQEQQLGDGKQLTSRLQTQLREAQQRVTHLAKQDTQRRASMAGLLVQRRASITHAAAAHVNAFTSQRGQPQSQSQPQPQPPQSRRTALRKRRRKRPGRSSLLSMYSLPSVSTQAGGAVAGESCDDGGGHVPHSQPALRSALMTLTS